MNAAAVAPSSAYVSDALPSGVRDLLARIESVENLHVVVALHQSRRPTMSVSELAVALNLRPTEIRHAARELRMASLIVECTGGEIQLLPPTSQEASTVSELVRLYGEDRFVIVHTLGEIALERIRTAMKDLPR